MDKDQLKAEIMEKIITHFDISFMMQLANKQKQISDLESKVKLLDKIVKKLEFTLQNIAINQVTNSALKTCPRCKGLKRTLLIVTDTYEPCNYCLGTGLIK